MKKKLLASLMVVSMFSCVLVGCAQNKKVEAPAPKQDTISEEPSNGSTGYAYLKDVSLNFSEMSLEEKDEWLKSVNINKVLFDSNSCLQDLSEEEQFRVLYFSNCLEDALRNKYDTAVNTRSSLEDNYALIGVSWDLSCRAYAEQSSGNELNKEYYINLASFDKGYFVSTGCNYNLAEQKTPAIYVSTDKEVFGVEYEDMTIYGEVTAFYDDSIFGNSSITTRSDAKVVASEKLLNLVEFYNDIFLIATDIDFDTISTEEFCTFCSSWTYNYVESMGNVSGYEDVQFSSEDDALN